MKMKNNQKLDLLKLQMMQTSEKMSDAERGEVYNDYIEKYGISIYELADKTKINRSTLANFIRVYKKSNGQNYFIDDTEKQINLTERRDLLRSSIEADKIRDVAKIKLIFSNITMTMLIQIFSKRKSIEQIKIEQNQKHDRIINELTELEKTIKEIKND